tara:strand:+ start:43 stop:1221 length:1179 start_codon:yes stop_codon:yes gene_type:complete
MTYPSIRPALTLDFANSKKLDNRIAFSRSSIGTYVDSSGLIKTAPVNVARFDHDSTGKPLGLLIEELRTNYIPNSTDFTGWSQVSGASIALSSAVTAPDGNTSSSLFTADDNTGYATVSYIIPGNTNAYLTLFVKAANESVFQLSSSRSTTMRGLFDMTTGLWSSTVGSADDYAAEAYPNGWWKLTVKGFIGGTSTIILYIAGPNITSADTDAFYMWGAQVEHGSFPTSYIPTAGSTVSRSKDVAQITGTNFSSWYNQNEGTIQVKYGSATNTSSNHKRLVSIGDSDSNSMSADNGIMYGSHNPSTSTRWRLRNGSSILNFALASPAALSSAIAYEDDNLAVSYDGETVLTNNSYTISTLPSRLDVHPNGHISRLSYYNERLTDAALQQLTK